MIIPIGTKERELIETFNDMEWIDREHLLEHAKNMLVRSTENGKRMKVFYIYSTVIRLSLLIKNISGR
ncbi:hypothetical protein [Butyrivibrio sp. XPD2002]|uniref:hypothetical protein n=1 Tax=Butyrivibrio sp. XPD2002 TaxID=1280665 RepID=UPI00040EA6AE|nr:hypothetical protein [Butyrivibrio sp. XPD2002]